MRPWLRRKSRSARGLEDTPRSFEATRLFPLRDDRETARAENFSQSRPEHPGCSRFDRTILFAAEEVDDNPHDDDARCDQCHNLPGPDDRRVEHLPVRSRAISNERDEREPHSRRRSNCERHWKNWKLHRSGEWWHDGANCRKESAHEKCWKPE